MFAVKDIKRALTWIFSLFDEEDIACLMLDDDDVVSELTPELQARCKACQNVLFLHGTGRRGILERIIGI